MKIIVMFGTRPEAIKMAPVIIELKKNPAFDVRVCFTGQHKDIALPFMELFGIVPDFKFTLENSNLSGAVAEMLQQSHALFEAEKPDLILVQGDTNSVLAASLTAFYHHVKVGHIEAGLRTHNKFSPFPEEMNRLLTTRLADLHFAPAEQSKQNLLNEGVPEKDIFVTGNTVIDALRLMTVKLEENKAFSDDLKARFPFVAEGKPFILLTGHRRENQDGGLVNISRALKEIAGKHPGVQIIYPVHPSPAVRGQVMPILEGAAQIHLCDPLDYPTFILLLQKCEFVMTDSGGVQEEAAALGKPIVLMRESTERPEIMQMTPTITVGSDAAKIIDAADVMLEGKIDRSKLNPDLLGKGDSAKQISEAIMSSLG